MNVIKALHKISGLTTEQITETTAIPTYEIEELENLDDDSDQLTWRLVKEIANATGVSVDKAAEYVEYEYDEDEYDE